MRGFEYLDSDNSRETHSHMTKRPSEFRSYDSKKSKSKDMQRRDKRRERIESKRHFD